jgi:two-component system chemotaxis response regulator CheY
MNQLKVILAEDIPAYRFAFKAMLKRFPNISVIGEASNGFELIELVKCNVPDIIFMDIEMPKLNGVEATKKVLEIHPGMVVIAVSMYDEMKYIEMMLDAGAKGYLSKFKDNFEVLRNIFTNPSDHLFFSQGINYHPKSNSVRKRILIVDDFEISNFIVSQELIIMGYDVYKASGGEEAIHYFDGRKIDLLITDYYMPKMDGIDLIRKIRNMETYKNIPIFVLSSVNDENKKIEALKVGANLWIKKPFDQMTFKKAIEKFLHI